MENRRKFLGTVAGVVAISIAGCNDSSEEEPEDENESNNGVSSATKIENSTSTFLK